MRRIDLLNDPTRAWEPFKPSRTNPWDRAKVAHLHRRAGFAADWATLEGDLADGPELSIERVLNGTEVAGDGTPAEAFRRLMDSMSAGPGVSGGLEGLQAAWLYRMIYTPHPLVERLTLFWHDHFATSNEKVNDPGLMNRQHQMLRQYALGDFGTLLRRIAKDPAMLIWLDATENSKSHPNENYAREVMELFALGRGHYSERDIQEAARAFTGTFVVRGRYRRNQSEFDPGTKAVLGNAGPFDGDAIAEILLQQPQCARFIVRKLFGLLVSEVDQPSAELLEPLAAAYRDSSYRTHVPVEIILRSQLFFDPSVRFRRVKSPVEFSVGTIRALEVVSPTVSTSDLAEACRNMGQSLFAPPSVAGWEGGRAWINTTTTLARSNAILSLVDDRRRIDPEGLATRHGLSKDPSQFYIDLLLQDGFSSEIGATVGDDPAAVLKLLLTSPEYQLA